MDNDSPAAAIRIVLADDHQLVRSGIKILLNRISGVEVVAEAGDGHALVQAVEHLDPQLVMTDLSMPRMDGLTAIRQIRASRPGLPIMVLSMIETTESVRRSAAAGASGYMMKNAQAMELEFAVRSMMDRGCYFGTTIAQRLLAPDAAGKETLTIRQVEILTLIARGQASKEIAYALGLSRTTVEADRCQIMARLGITGIAGLTRYAIRRGLVVP